MAQPEVIQISSNGVWHETPSLSVDGISLGKFPDIRARHKRAIARARQDQGADIIVVSNPLKRGRKLRDERVI